MTGQFDAGECWKCQITRLRRERDIMRRAFNKFVQDMTGAKDG